MKHTVLAFAALALPLQASADGLPLIDGRYPGRVLVFKLTQEQRMRIETFRTCHIERLATMNVYTPYVFALAPDQVRKVRSYTGYAPRWFQVYETYRGYNDAGPHWNMALRFNEDEFEVPLKLLLPDRGARKALEVIGWKPENPCFPEVRQ